MQSILKCSRVKGIYDGGTPDGLYCRRSEGRLRTCVGALDYFMQKISNSHTY